MRAAFWRAFAAAVVAAMAAHSPAASIPCETNGLFDRVGKRYGIDPMLLYAIAQTESGARPDRVARNKNGTVDHGAMQINSVHLPTLARFGITKEDLYNPCVNVDVGAWVLARCFARWNVTWEAVGCYNSETPRFRDAYARTVAARYQRLRSGRYSHSAGGRAPQQPLPPSPELNSAALSSRLVCTAPAGCVVERTQGGQLLVTEAASQMAGLLVR